MKLILISIVLALAYPNAAGILAAIRIRLNSQDQQLQRVADEDVVAGVYAILLCFVSIAIIIRI